MVKENLILYDWFSFTAKHHSADTIISLLGMDISSFETIHGMYGYLERLYFDGISVYFGGREGVWCEMSGQGCRTFETFGSGAWDTLFDEILSNKEYHIARLDVAFDDHIGVLNLDVLKREAEAKNYVSKMIWGKVERGLHDDAITIYHGSPKSDVRFRIYDKAKERGREDEGHWVRFEIQLRDDHAARFISFAVLKPIGEVFVGVINNSLRYIKPPDGCDTNKRRWEIADYWYNFIHTSEKISLYQKPGTEYNIGNLEHYVVHQAGAAAAVYVDIFGLDEFISKCAGKLKASNNQKYADLLSRYSGGKLTAAIPKPQNTNHPQPQITCESCKAVLPSTEFIWYDLKTNMGICRGCHNQK